MQAITHSIAGVPVSDLDAGSVSARGSAAARQPGTVEKFILTHISATTAAVGDR